jgi:hypothetical protein
MGVLFFFFPFFFFFFFASTHLEGLKFINPNINVPSVYHQSNRLWNAKQFIIDEGKHKSITLKILHYVHTNQYQETLTYLVIRLHMRDFRHGFWASFSLGQIYFSLNSLYISTTLRFIWIEFF